MTFHLSKTGVFGGDRTADATVNSETALWIHKIATLEAAEPRGVLIDFIVHTLPQLHLTMREGRGHALTAKLLLPCPADPLLASGHGACNMELCCKCEFWLLKTSR